MTSGDVAGTSSPEVLEVLQFALLLKYLASDLYARGLDATGLIPVSHRTVLVTISAHEAAHVTALQALITARGGTPPSAPAFDFAAQGAFPEFSFQVTQYDAFLAIAHTLEDTVVRAFKGQMARLMTDKAVLTVALSMHSVDARHASQVRRLRGKKGWITGNTADELPAFAQATYDGEDNTTHLGVNALPLASGSDHGASATEAFDEPLTMAQAAAIVALFLSSRA